MKQIRQVATRMVGVLAGVMGCTLFTLQAQTNGDYPSLLWEISGKGMEKQSYLYGTMHVSRKVAFHLSDTFFFGLRQCDVVALESDPGNWMEDLFESERLGETLGSPSVYGRLRYRNFYTKAFDLPIPDPKSMGRMLARDHGLMNGFLYRYSGNGENFEENTYLDLFIYQAGYKWKKQVTNLEKYSEVSKLQDKAREPHPSDKERRKRRSKLRRSGLNASEQIEDAYRKGNLDMLDSLGQIIYAHNYRKYMLIHRNVGMAQNMDSILQTGQSLFTGIGAAHLPGDSGVIDLLRGMGYTLRPVSRTISNHSQRTKEKLEGIQVGLDYNKTTAPDSSFQVHLPGRLFQTPGKNGQSVFFHPEMINGAYYVVTRMTTHAPLLGQDPAYLRSRIDSLLYENIPGKIVRQRDITHQGYPGYDILNKTRRGDYQRYRILITPLEVWVFKVGGTGDFAKGKDGDKFLESLELEPYVSRGWQTFQPPSGGFEVELPGTIRYEKVAGNPGRYFQDDILQAFDPSNDHYYLLVRASMHDFEYIEEDTFELNRLAESVAEDLGYESHDRSLGMWQGYPYLQARLSRETRPDLFLRVLIRGGHYYLMMARTPEVPERFFTSFRVAPNHYADTASLKQDSLLQFSVHSMAQSRSNANRARRFTRFLELDNDQPSDHTNLSRRTVYSYPKTGERIAIQYWRMHKFHQVKDTAELWERQLEILTNDGDLVVRSRHSDTLQGMPTLDVELTDTNSIRCIRARSILKERVLYTLWTMGDTLTPSTPLVEAFFDSFQPSDSTVLPSVLEDKAEQFLTDILSADSATQAQARDALSRVNLEDRHASAVMQLIEDFEYRDDLEPLNKAHLIQKLGELHAEAVVPYLEELYDRVGDTATFQFAILHALAHQRTAAATRVFGRLLHREAPLASRHFEVADIFKPYWDSLQLAIPLYPGLFEYTRYPEYKATVYGILSALVDSNYVDGQLYADEKRIIFKDARDELRRHLASYESVDKSRYSTDRDEYYDDYQDYTRLSSKYRSVLEDYCALLIPYDGDPAVRAFFQRLNDSPDDRLRMQAALLRLHHGVSVPDSLWNAFAGNDNLRVPLYLQLKRLDRLDKLSTELRSQAHMTRAQLYAWGVEEGKDSLEFIGKRWLTLKRGSGYVYFYKLKREDEDDWQIDYVGVQPADSARISMQVSLRQKGLDIDPDKTQEAQLDEIMRDLRWSERKRAKQAGTKVDGFDENFWVY